VGVAFRHTNPFNGGGEKVSPPGNYPLNQILKKKEKLYKKVKNLLFESLGGVPSALIEKEGQEFFYCC